MNKTDPIAYAASEVNSIPALMGDIEAGLRKGISVFRNDNGPQMRGLHSFEKLQDALAQPCQECEALREKLAAAERERDAALDRECETSDALQEALRTITNMGAMIATAERQLAEAREALRQARQRIIDVNRAGFDSTRGVYALRGIEEIDAALAATEREA